MSLLSNTSVGCIGIGNMGSAIVTGLARSMDIKSISCYDIEPDRIQDAKRKSGVRSVDSLEELCRDCEVIIIAVKPDAVPALLREMAPHITGKISVSVAAGVGLETMESLVPRAVKIARVMPNTPALVRKGMTVISPNREMDEGSLKMVEEIFSHLGAVMVLPERFMNAVTGLSGSGPAYIFTMISALADGGVKMGLPRDKALVLAAQTALGAAEMVLETGQDPMTLRAKVASPGGTTIEGLHILDRAGFSGIIMDAVEAATTRASRLSEKKA
jgi:pyrroline-5-carboxylate reductase